MTHSPVVVSTKTWPVAVRDSNLRLDPPCWSDGFIRSGRAQRARTLHLLAFPQPPRSSAARLPASQTAEAVTPTGNQPFQKIKAHGELPRTSLDVCEFQLTATLELTLESSFHIVKRSQNETTLREIGPTTMKHQLLRCFLVASMPFLAVSCKDEAHVSGSGGRGYGNLFVQYGYSRHGNRPREIQWAIIFTEIPSKINSLRGEGVISGEFQDGSEFETAIDGDAVLWLSPGTKAQRIGIVSPGAFITMIEETQNEAVDLEFDGPNSLAEHLQGTNAESDPPD